jgi:hypothetical protein
MSSSCFSLRSFLRAAALVGAALVPAALAGQAVAAETTDVSFVTGVFLASPEVARALAAEGRQLVVDRIVTGDTIVDGLVRTTPVCVGLSWFGGDTLGSYGTIEGEVVARPQGRGVDVDVRNVALQPWGETSHAALPCL